MPVYSQDNPQRNLGILGENVYPGRLLVVGFTGNVAVQAYAVEGRSDDSRNRILVVEDKVVSTETFDKSSPPEHPELTIYDAMRRVGKKHIVSNGDQTSTAIQHIRSGFSFDTAMEARDYEGDPNHTSRISAYVIGEPEELVGPSFGISVLRKSARSDRTMRRTWLNWELGETDGVGYCVHTYKGDAPPGKKIPSFTEAPFPVPVLGSAEEMAEMLWQALDHTNLVAVAAKIIRPNGKVKFHVINMHEQPPQAA